VLSTSLTPCSDHLCLRVSFDRTFYHFRENQGFISPAKKIFGRRQHMSGIHCIMESKDVYLSNRISSSYKSPTSAYSRIDAL